MSIADDDGLHLYQQIWLATWLRPHLLGQWETPLVVGGRYMSGCSLSPLIINNKGWWINEVCGSLRVRPLTAARLRSSSPRCGSSDGTNGAKTSVNGEVNTAVLETLTRWNKLALARLSCTLTQASRSGDVTCELTRSPDFRCCCPGFLLPAEPNLVGTDCSRASAELS